MRKKVRRVLAFLMAIAIAVSVMTGMALSASAGSDADSEATPTATTEDLKEETGDVDTPVTMEPSADDADDADDTADTDAADADDAKDVDEPSQQEEQKDDEKASDGNVDADKEPAPADEDQDADAAPATTTDAASEQTVTVGSGDKTVKVKIKAAAGVLPEGAKLTVKKLASTDSQYSRTADTLDNSSLTWDDFLALDVSFEVNGTEVEPDGAVDVQFELGAGLLPDAADAASLAVQHLEESGKVETVAAAGNGTVAAKNGAVQADFTVDSFSVFAITYGCSKVTVHRVDTNGVELDKGTTVSKKGCSAWTAIGTYADAVEGYEYVAAHLGGYKGTAVTYIKYQSNCKDSGWRYSSASSKPDNKSNGDKIGCNSIYLVYKAHNKQETNKLTITKTISDNNKYGDPDVSGIDYTFTVKGPANMKDGTYGDVTFTKGTATVTITGANSKTIEGLPVGTYTVTETTPTKDPAGYTFDKATTMIGGATLTAAKAGTVIITNQYKVDKIPSASGSLVIEKTFKGLSEAQIDALKDRLTFGYTLSNGTVRLVKLNQFTESNGTYTYTVSNLNPKTIYTVGEFWSTAKVEGYDVVTTVKGCQLGIIGTCNATVRYNNAYIAHTGKTNDLTITKTISDNNKYGDPDVSGIDYTFTVKGPANMKDGTYGDVTFTKGTATVTITGANSKTIEGLPLGTYTVTETTPTKDPAGYTFDKATTMMGATTLTAAKAGTVIITNQYKVDKIPGGSGSLVIEKTFEGLSEAQIDALKDRLTFGYTLSNGTVRLIKLNQFTESDGTYTYTVSNLNPKTIYTVGEFWTTAKVEGYDVVTTVKGCQIGFIGKRNATVHYNNAYTAHTGKTNDLTITKAISDNNESGDPDVSGIDYTFTVKGPANMKDGTYGDVTFTKGTATVTITGANSKTIPNLPLGTYTVTETTPTTDPEGYTFDKATTMTGATTLTTAKAGTVIITNQYKVNKIPGASGSLVIEKTFEGLSEAQIDALKDRLTFGYTLSNGTVRLIKLNQFTESEGTYTYTVSNLNPKTIYTVGEFWSTAKVEGYDVVTTVKGHQLGFIGTSGATVHYNNAYTAHTGKTNDLTITKAVSDNNESGDPDVSGIDYTFTVKGPANMEDGTYNGVTFTKGTATVTITGANSTTITGLPLGTYTVTETTPTTDPKGYTFDKATIMTGEATLTAAKAGTVTITNQYKVNETPGTPGTLTIEKTIEGLSEAQIDALKDDLTFNYTLNDGTAQSVKLNQFTLSNGTYTYTISDLTPTTTYTVSEVADTAAVSGYDVVTTVTGNQSGTIGETGATVRYNNAYTAHVANTNSLTITKAVSGVESAAVAEIPYTFTIQGPEGMADSTYGDVTFTKGTATVTITGANSKTITGLPLGTYTVTETTPTTDPEGYTFDSATIMTGEATLTDADAGTVTITNQYQPKNITVTILKDVTGNMGDTDQEFSFTATGVEDGFTLKDKDSNASSKQEITIPYGGSFTVTESDYSDDGYTTSYQVGEDAAVSGSTYTAESLTEDTTITFINDNQTATPTGLVGNAAPYMIMVGAAAVVGAGYLIARHRRRSN